LQKKLDGFHNVRHGRLWQKHAVVLAFRGELGLGHKYDLNVGPLVVRHTRQGEAV
jgi:hypothetical protein